MFRHIVRSSMVMLALGFAACDDVPTTVPVDDSEAVFDPTFDVTLPPDGGTCPDVFYEESRLLSNGVTVTWTSVLAGFDYAEGTGYMADVNWSVDQGTATYQDFTGRSGPNTWTPKRKVDGVMTPGAAGEGTIPVTVSMTPMHQAGVDDDDDDDGGWDGKIGNGHFWLRLEIDNGERRPKRVKLGVNFHLEDPADGFGTQCPGDDPPVDPPVGNQLPTADAGGNQTVTDTDDGGDESVTLDGSGSTDPDGSIASWVWTEGASEVATGETPTVTFAVGTHTVTLTVMDDQGATDTDQVVITVEAAPPAGNKPPTADAGANQTVTDTDDGGDESVTLDGSGSMDPDGSIASWVWTEGASEIATGETPLVTFAVGTHTVTLTVTDNEGATDTDQVVITVEAAPSGISFKDDIQPYFQIGDGQAGCVMCHSGGGGRKGVNLDSHTNIMAGGDDGPLVVPFDSNASNALLVPQLESTHHDGPGDAGFIVILKQWIDAGAENN